jgi:hypothetical protein
MQRKGLKLMYQMTVAAIFSVGAYYLGVAHQTDRQNTVDLSKVIQQMAKPVASNDHSDQPPNEDMTELKQQITLLTERLNSMEEQLYVTELNPEAGQMTPTVDEQRYRQARSNQILLTQFSQKPEDPVWQQQVEDQFYRQMTAAEPMLIQAGVTVEGLECRQHSCKLSVLARNSKDHAIALAFFPWDSTSQFLPDPDNPSRGSYIVEKVEPLVARVD